MSILRFFFLSLRPRAWIAPFLLFGWSFSLHALDIGEPVRLGSAGSNLDVEFNEQGRGHLVYRRSNGVFYRHFDGSFWGSEIQLNTAGSPAATRKADQNQPKISLDAVGGAFVIWASNPPTDRVYIRHLSGTGQILGELQTIRPPAGVEDLAIRYWPEGGELHLFALLINDSGLQPTPLPGGPISDGSYAMPLNPFTFAVQSARRLSPAGTSTFQKNLDSGVGETVLFETGRFNRSQFGVYDGTWFVDYLPLEGFAGTIGASQLAVLGDDELHLATTSFVLETELRDLNYYRYQPSTNTVLDSIPLDPEFDSFLGIAAIEAASTDRVFISWDRVDEKGFPQIAFAFQDEKTEGFIGPLPLPQGSDGGAGEQPATGIVGNQIHLVFNDPIDESLWATVADFELESPPTPTATATATPEATATPTSTQTPSPTATPQVVEPGIPVSSVYEVGSLDEELRVDYRIYNDLDASCQVELMIFAPEAELFGSLMVQEELRQVRILDPVAGSWNIEAVVPENCEESQELYLNLSSAALASSFADRWNLWLLGLLLVGLYATRRRTSMPSKMPSTK